MSKSAARVAVVTGGAGVLCSAIAKGLAQDGITVVLLDLALDKAEAVAEIIRSKGGAGLALRASVLDRGDLEAAAEKILATYGRIDILINGAGGNHPKATTSEELSFFDLPEESVRFVFDLNFLGTLLPSQVFGRVMAETGTGVILNIASMNAFRPLTRIPAYSAAKAAITNFTQWLAVHMAQNVSKDIRVNAIAPGFFLTDQNRFLLTTESGDLTPRGSQIIGHTPMGKFGEPEDLVGTVNWLVSPNSSFVHGIVVPIDGGFSAYSGV
jgi:NAD(P)-dependent dehydrogenase (short-subunit alcohol dehydrogenase family)